MGNYDHILEVAGSGRFDFLVTVEKENPYRDPKTGQYTTGPGGAASTGDAATALRDGIRSGKISTRLDRKKQAKHIKGSDRYNKAIREGLHPSTLSIDQRQQQALINTYTKTGTPFLRKNGSVRVRFHHSSTIGTYVSSDGSIAKPTQRGQIHFSSSGAHIVPDLP